MVKQTKVVVRKSDGTELEGHLVRSFNQMASRFEIIDAQGHQQTFAMDDIECILFFHPEGASHLSLRRLPNDVIEHVFLKSGATYTVISNAQQEEVNGFFGFPDPAEHPDIQRIFFVQANVLGRKLASSFGELLEESGVVDHQTIEGVVKQQCALKQQRVGDILVEKGVSKREDLEKAVVSFGGIKKRLHVGEMFLKAGLITQEQLDMALEEQKRSKNKKIGDILVEKGIIDEEMMLTCLAKQLRIHFVDLSTMEPEPDALMELTASIARELHVIPMSLHDNVLKVATSEPNNLDLVNKLQFHTGRRIHLLLARKQQIEEKIKQYYRDDIEEFEAFEIESVELNEESWQSSEVLANEAEQTPIVRLVNRILKDGVEANASDIHIMIREGRVVVDLRVNGVLSEYMNFSLGVLNPLVTRFKIIAKMDIAEHRLPQDGRIRLHLPEREVEFRVSCVPSVHGETLVLRILEKKKDGASLTKVGLAPDDLARMQRICQSDHGLVLITGPTGSGKSTTMVGAISDLLGKGKRLISLEDPVEAEVPGVLQVQVHSKIGFTFARALRNLLRHDPDIIMVGEIRDGETAEVAVEAALTGHLLISSLHTNTAAGAFSRLINMGAEAYLVAATVKGVMAQRLLPKICEHCKYAVEVPDDARVLLEHAHADIEAEYFASDGCAKCHNTGIAGRKLVYELIEVNEAISKLVSDGAPEHRIREEAEKNGMRSISRMAVDYALAGEVALRYVLPLLAE